MMSKRNLFFTLIGSGLVVIFILTSCQATATPVAPASAISTSTPLAPTATFTVVPSLTETATPFPTATPIPTATEPAIPTIQLTPQVNPGMNAYCRKGPGTAYHAITFLRVGTFYNVIGQNGLNTWWLVQVPGKFTCWMGDATSVMQGPVWQVPILMAPPLPHAPSSFLASYVCNPKMHSLKVMFEWVPVPNVIGYRIYRNDSLLVELGSTVKVYQDNSAPLALDLVYTLEAFNDYGASPGISAKVTSCGD